MHSGNRRLILFGYVPRYEPVPWMTRVGPPDLYLGEIWFTQQPASRISAVPRTFTGPSHSFAARV